MTYHLRPLARTIRHTETAWRHFLAWLADAALGPRCEFGCGHRARGWRTLDAHVELEHAGDEGVRR